MAEPACFQITAVETSRDGRGWVSNLLDFLPLPREEIRNVHLAEFRPGQVRGNHWHRGVREWIVLLGGPCRVAIEENGERREFLLAGDRPQMLHLPPGVAHAIRYEGDRVAYLAAFTDTPYDFGNPDAVAVSLL